MIMFDIRFSSRPCLVSSDHPFECTGPRHPAQAVVRRAGNAQTLYIAAVAAAQLIGPTAVTLRGTVNQVH